MIYLWFHCEKPQKFQLCRMELTMDVESVRK